MRKAQRRIGQHEWDTKVGYTKGILLIRILSYCVALFRVLHLSVTSKCRLIYSIVVPIRTYTIFVFYTIVWYIRISKIIP